MTGLGASIHDSLLNMYRVASASGAYGSQSYTYDGVGNRLTRVVSGTTETYA